MEREGRWEKAEVGVEAGERFLHYLSSPPPPRVHSKALEANVYLLNETPVKRNILMRKVTSYVQSVHH